MSHSEADQTGPSQAPPPGDTLDPFHRAQVFKKRLAYPSFFRRVVRYSTTSTSSLVVITL